MPQDALQILFADRVEDALAAAASRRSTAPSRRRSRSSARQAAALGHVAEPLAGERRIPVAARELHVLRIAAAALLEDDARASPSAARERIDGVSAAASAPPGGRPRAPTPASAPPGCSSTRRCRDTDRSSRRRRARAPRRSAAACRRSCPSSTLPMILWCVTCVGRPPFSPISIVSRTLSSDARRLVAHVRDVDAAHRAGDLRELDHFRRRRERARARRTGRSSGRTRRPRIPCRTSPRIFSISSARRLAVDRSDHLHRAPSPGRRTCRSSA